LRCPNAKCCRPAGQGEAGQPPSGPSRPSIVPTFPLRSGDLATVVDRCPGPKLVLSFGPFVLCASLPIHPIKPRPNPRLRALLSCQIASGSKLGPCFQGCQAGRPGRGRSAWVFTQFCPFLVDVHLKSKLIQNLWNSLEINKI
jgi:hypothetical protein